MQKILSIINSYVIEYIFLITDSKNHICRSIFFKTNLINYLNDYSLRFTILTIWIMNLKLVQLEILKRPQTPADFGGLSRQVGQLEVGAPSDHARWLAGGPGIGSIVRPRCGFSSPSFFCSYPLVSGAKSRRVKSGSPPCATQAVILVPVARFCLIPLVSHLVFPDCPSQSIGFCG